MATRHEIETSLNYACSRLPQGTTKSGDEAGYQQAQQRCNRFATGLEPGGRNWVAILLILSLAVIAGLGLLFWRHRGRFS